jgi:hypothetical protein
MTAKKCLTLLATRSNAATSTTENFFCRASLKRGFPSGHVSPDSPYASSARYMDVIEEQLKALRSAREKYIILDSVMSAMATHMEFGDELIAEVDRFIADVSEPKATGLEGFFGLE